MDNSINTEGGASIQGNANVRDGDLTGRDKISIGQQEQRGDNSVNYQAQSLTVINHGLSYPDVRQIALDIFQQNFYQLSKTAGEVASQRAKEITDRFLEQLHEQNPDGLKQAEDPDFQYTLFTAQREYARIGDRQLEDLLVDMLVERTKEDTRSLQSIALSESLTVVSKLTAEQINTLTLVFLIRYTVWNHINSIPSLVKLLIEVGLPLVSYLPKKDSAYQHLESMRCGTIQITDFLLGNFLLNAYSGLFCKGFSQKDIRDIILPDGWGDLFIPCLHDNALWQLGTINSQGFQIEASRRGIEGDKIANLLSLQQRHLMNDKEVIDLLIKSEPRIASLTTTWDQTPVKNLSLSSIGIAIAHTNAKRLLGQFSPLSTWL